MSRRLAVLLSIAAAVACGSDSPVAPQPVVPMPIAPVNGVFLPNGCFDFSQEKHWDFDWTDVPAASAYHLYVIGPSAANPIIDRQDITSSSHRHTSTSWTGAQAGWTWRVRARVGGTFREWSPTATFNVTPPNQGC